MRRSSRSANEDSPQLSGQIGHHETLPAVVESRPEETVMGGVYMGQELQRDGFPNAHDQASGELEFDANDFPLLGSVDREDLEKRRATERFATTEKDIERERETAA